MNTNADERRESNFRAAQLLEVELAAPIPAIVPGLDESGRCYGRAVVLVRLHTEPLGSVEIELPAGGIAAIEHAELLWSRLRGEVMRHLERDGIRVPTRLSVGGLERPIAPACLRQRQQVLRNPLTVSVVISTRDRTDQLGPCLDSLFAMEYPSFEVVVVDNAPLTDGTERFIRRRYGRVGNIRYVREEAPGLSQARNRGLMEAEGDIVAFTDDDVVVDRFWLAELVRGFLVAENAGCVTGMVLAREIETPAQEYFEQFGGFSKGFEPRIFDMEQNRPRSSLFPYAAGTFGTGANMAFRTSVLRSMGGFDPALGAGSAAMGGEDLAAFFEIIIRGHRLVYQPGAMVRHRHRRDVATLQRQMYTYGMGLTAFLARVAVDHPEMLPDLARRVPAGLWYALHPASEKNRKKPKSYPRELTMIEWRGMLHGPVAYLRSRRARSPREARNWPANGHSRGHVLEIFSELTGPGQT